MKNLKSFFFVTSLLLGTWGCNHSTTNLSFWADNAGSPAARFELAKRSEPELIAYVRKMPKGADLHNHAIGATYSEFVLDVAETKGLNYDCLTRKFKIAPAAGSIISVDSLKREPVCLAQFLDTYSMRGWHPNTNNGNDHFFSTFKYLDSSEFPEVILQEVIRRNRFENVQYLELMLRSVPKQVENQIVAALKKFAIEDLDSAFEQAKPIIQDAKTIESIQRELDKLDDNLQKELQLKDPLTGNKGDIIIRYIHQLKRFESPQRFFATAAAAILAINHDPRVVALNMVTPENSPASQKNFDAQMKILDFLWNKMGQPKFSLHAGELVLRESPVEPMRDRISQAVMKGHALRIGHGVSIAWENDVVGLLNHMRENGILVEICLSSNEAVLGVKDTVHPFMLYRRARVPISINTDDEGVNRSNLTMEFVKAIQRYNLKYDEVKELIRNSLEYSFLPGNSIFVKGNYKNLRPEFRGVQSKKWKPDQNQEKLMAENPKLNQQAKLERAFVEFETLLMRGFATH